jgi:hypothetical protein
LRAVVRVGKILENSTDYSIQNTLRQALFLPTTREAQYKANAAIDTFFKHGGDVVSAGFVGLGQVAGLTVSAFRGHQRGADTCVAVGGWSNCAGASPPDGIGAKSLAFG